MAKTSLNFFSCSSLILSFIQSQWLIFFHFFFNIISFIRYLFPPFLFSFSQSFFLFFFHINFFCYFFFWNLFLPFYLELVFRFCLFVFFFFLQLSAWSNFCYSVLIYACTNKELNPINLIDFFWSGLDPKMDILNQ